MASATGRPSAGGRRGFYARHSQRLSNCDLPRLLVQYTSIVKADV
jgi:hypothetical protein